MVLFVVLAVFPSRARADADPGILNYVLSSEPESLDPAWAYDATSAFVIQQMYEGLVDFDGTSLDAFVPKIASVVPTRGNGFLSPDAMTYSFPIRKGVKFHDGTIMTADDVKYSLMRFLLTDRDGGPSSLLLEPLIGRRTVLGPNGKPDPEVFDLLDRAVDVEGGAVVLRLQRPFAPLLSVLAGSGHVVSKAFAIAHGGWDGKRATWTSYWNPPREKSALYADEDGTGPFKLDRWDRDIKRVALARHDGYWRSPATLARAAILTVEDPRVRRKLLETGDADVVQIDARSIPYFQNIPGAVVDTGLPLLQVDDVIFFNFAVDPKDNPWLGSGQLDGAGIPPDFFADLDVRKGFAQAFDYDGFIREGFGGGAERARGPIPKGLAGYNVTRQRGWLYSLDESSKSFHAARNGEIWDRGFLLPVAYPEGSPDRHMACRVLQSGLAQLNAKFRVDCRPISQPRLLEELRARRLSAFVYRWVLDYPDPHSAVEPFLASDGFFASRLGYSNPRADDLVARAEAETDPAARKAEYGELQALAIYDLPAIFTVETPGALARRVKVQNWLHHPIQPYGILYPVTKLP